jgi:steroid delta-isomerase-like uncharacterized protein
VPSNESAGSPVVTQPGTPTQQSTPAEQAFRSYLAAFNRSDVEALARVYALKTEFVNPFSPEPITTREAVRAFVGSMFAAYADMTARVDDVIVAGSRVAARLTIRGRHTGALRRPGGAIAATGRTVELRTAEFFRVGPNGLITEHLRIFDSAAVLAQLGQSGQAGP